MQKYPLGRKNGVSVNQGFYQILEESAYLTNSHFLFFENLFFKYFQHQRKIFVADCYLFWEYMPKLSDQISKQLIDEKKIEEIQKRLEQKKVEEQLTQQNSCDNQKQENIMNKPDLSLLESIISPQKQLIIEERKQEIQQVQQQDNNQMIQQEIQNKNTKEETEKQQQIEQIKKLNASNDKQKDDLKSVGKQIQSDIYPKTQQQQPKVPYSLIQTQQQQPKVPYSLIQTQQQQPKVPYSVIQNNKSDNQNFNESRLNQTQKIQSSITIDQSKLTNSSVQFRNSQYTNNQTLNNQVIQSNQPTQINQESQKINPTQQNTEIQNQNIVEKQTEPNINQKQKENKPTKLFEILSIQIEQKNTDQIHQTQKIKELLFKFTINQEKIKQGNPIYNYDYAYFPINLNNSHWISVIVFIKERKIFYVDSLGGYKQEIIDGIKKILNFEQSQPIDDWKIYNNTPLQQNGWDCGVFTLYSLYYIYQYGLEINKTSYDQKKISQVRKQMIELVIAELSEELNSISVSNIMNKI